MSDADCPCGHNVEEHEDHTGCAQCTCLRLPSEVAIDLRTERDAAKASAYEHFTRACEYGVLRTDAERERDSVRAALADLKRERDEHVRECVRLGGRVLEEEARAIRAEDERDDARTLAVALENEVARLREALTDVLRRACTTQGIDTLPRMQKELMKIEDAARAALSADQPAPTTRDES